MSNNLCNVIIRFSIGWNLLEKEESGNYLPDFLFSNKYTLCVQLSILHIIILHYKS